MELGTRFFPDRDIVVQSGEKSYRFSLAGPVQAAAVLALLIGASSTATVAYQTYEAHRETLLQRAAIIASLKAELAEVRQQAVVSEQTLVQLAALADDKSASIGDDAAADPSALAEKVNDRIESLERQLAAANAQKSSIENARDRLANEEGKLQKSVGELKQAKNQEKEKAEAIAKAVETASAERDRLRQRVTELEKKLQKLSALQERKAQMLAESRAAEQAVADARAQANQVGAAAASDGADSVAENEESEEEAPSSANVPVGGFNLDKYLAQYGLGLAHGGTAVGGPFVALGNAKAAGHGMSAEAAAVLRSVPLTAPLASYRFESGFGVRVDPMRHRRSVHTGLDLSAPYKSPVYSTSAGIVVFAGYSGAYGNMVEIDHGHGFHTRYAHLNRLLTSAGRHVSEHTEIGLLGSTGRSTGPHVHYEVLVNGVAQNPMPFLTAGAGVIVKTAD